jgi:uncharacterized coiled-coil protein SlyX
MSSIELLKTMVEQGKAQLLLQTQQLAVLEKQLFDLENPVETRPLSDAEMEKRVIDLETRKAFKWSWKRAIDDGLLSNIVGIMNECTYLSYIEIDVGENATDEEKRAAKEKSEKYKAYLGPFGGLKWQLFLLQIIKNLHKEGSFVDEEGGFDTFEDTAGGCDEILYMEGCEILKKSE